jgi:hypothetical protein
VIIFSNDLPPINDFYPHHQQRKNLQSEAISPEEAAKKFCAHNKVINLENCAYGHRMQKKMCVI